MALKVCKLLGDRYLFDDAESGLYFDLYPLKRVSGEDEDGLNSRINEAGAYLESIQGDNRVWRPTLFLLQSQIDAMPERFLLMFAAKTYLMYFRPGANVADINVQYWRDYGADGFLWSSSDKVFTKWDANMLGHRYRVAKEKEVNDFLDGIEPPVITPPDDDTPPVVYPTIPEKWHIHGKLGFFNVDLTVESAEEE